MDDDRLGSMEQRDDGRWQVRFVRRLAHPRERVWRALTDDEHLAAWFPTTVVGERRTGAPAQFGFPDAGTPPFEGRFLAVEPPEVLELDWGGDLLRFDLAADGAGTVLTLTTVLADRGTGARTAAGWHVCLDALEHDALGNVAGEGRGRAPHEAWAPVHAVYVERFGPEAATVGPPEGA